MRFTKVVLNMDGANPQSTAGRRRRGGYALVVGFPGGKVKLRKGELDLDPGAYVYSGSALGGLSGRIGRHRRVFYRGGGGLHWHIDALLGGCDRAAAICAESGIRTECRLVRELASAQGMEPVGGFGSTDCRAGCRGHLLRSRLCFDDTLAAVACAFRRIGLEPFECGRWDRAGAHGNGGGASKRTSPSPSPDHG